MLVSHHLTKAAHAAQLHVVYLKQEFTRMMVVLLGCCVSCPPRSYACIHTCTVCKLPICRHVSKEQRRKYARCDWPAVASGMEWGGVGLRIALRLYLNPVKTLVKPVPNSHECPAQPWGHNTSQSDAFNVVNYSYANPVVSSILAVEISPFLKCCGLCVKAN